MKWIYYIVFFLLLGCIFFGVFVIQEGVAKETEIQNVRYPKYEIHIDKPQVTNKVLKNIILDYLDQERNVFLENLKNICDSYFTYFLDISGKQFIYNNYVSYVFFKEEYLGGAHPNTYIWTVVFDLDTENIVTLENLTTKDVTFLNYVSESIRGDLLFQPYITNTSLLYAGTRPLKSNFQYFVLVDEGILFYFPPYQVAPYSSGVIEAFVSYSV